MARKNDNNRTSAPRPSVSRQVRATPKTIGAPGGIASRGDAKDPETLVTRRRFLYGAIGVGAVAAVGVGVGIASQGSQPDPAADIDYLNAPKSALTTLNDLEALDSPEGLVQLIAQHDLPYGTLLWANDDDVAACLLPTETGSPLAQVGLLFLGSGNVSTVLEKAVGAENGFEIYDVRATSSGIIWTEANILQGAWRVYGAALSNGDQLEEPRLLEEGDDVFDTPMLAVSGKRAFWQVLPKPDNVADHTSRLMGTTFGKAGTEVVLECNRRMGTPPYGGADSVTVAPRVDSSSVYYELTNIDAATGEVRDKLVLPRSVAPLEAGYGSTGFMFSFPDIYDFEGAIANLGTYTPFSKPSNGDYNSAQWFDFARTPTAPPAWCGDYLIVKSSYSVCGVNLRKSAYFAIDVEDGADTYGEYLASTGVHDTFVTFTNVDHTPVEGAPIHACRVKVWAPAASSGSASDDSASADVEPAEYTEPVTPA